MEQKLFTVESFANSIDANIAKGQLESEGIKCFLRNDTIVGNTGLNIAYGDIELVILEKDIEKAKAIL
ncbi:MAG: DUF2007 domain-containing protein, partial [Candidatus Aenigmarchaeota archaeon]|nr:DUF2007 domain-containing protein [Candidatus Aenigmarchaeota archaeon]